MVDIANTIWPITPPIPAVALSVIQRPIDRDRNLRGVREEDRKGKEVRERETVS